MVQIEKKKVNYSCDLKIQYFRLIARSWEFSILLYFFFLIRCCAYELFLIQKNNNDHDFRFSPCFKNDFSWYCTHALLVFALNFPIWLWDLTFFFYARRLWGMTTYSLMITMFKRHSYVVRYSEKIKIKINISYFIRFDISFSFSSKLSFELCH